MADWVYRSSNDPNGPRLVMKAYTTNPTSTVGRAIRVLSRPITTRRPRKRPSPTNRPKGRARIEAMTVEVSATVNDTRMGPQTSGSKENSSTKPSLIPSQIIFSTTRPDETGSCLAP